MEADKKADEMYRHLVCEHLHDLNPPAYFHRIVESQKNGISQAKLMSEQELIDANPLGTPLIYTRQLCLIQPDDYRILVAFQKHYQALDKYLDDWSAQHPEESVKLFEKAVCLCETEGHRHQAINRITRKLMIPERMRVSYGCS